MEAENRRTLKIDPRDNVRVALVDLAAGERVGDDGAAFALRESVPARHKFAVRDLAAGGRIVMYGAEVGRATRSIRAGERLSPQNTAHSQEPIGEDAGGEYSGRAPWEPPELSAWTGRTFAGFHRADGRVGTANYWLVVPLVFCINRSARLLEEALGRALGDPSAAGWARRARSLLESWRTGGEPEAFLEAPCTAGRDETLRVSRSSDRGGTGTCCSRSAGRRSPSASSRVDGTTLGAAGSPEEGVRWPFPRVDGVRFLTHALGCGGTGEDAASLCRLLAGYIAHPNVAGATVLSLGCQKATPALLREALAAAGGAPGKPVRVFDQQECGTQDRLLEEALRFTLYGLAVADRAERKPAPLSRLVLGVKCGGSDGFSGLSANPAIGRAADLLVALGGSVLLAEFPELAGAENNLLNRCVSPEVGEKFLRLQRAYIERARSVGSGFADNPSDGNVREGLITGAMKSAGAVRKGGTSPVADVLDYAEPVTRPGLSLLCTPGNDGESVTGMVGSGATLVLFSTGLGTPTGDPVAPVIKVATHSALARRMPDIIDADAGPILTGQATVEEKGAELLELCRRVAGGEVQPKAHSNGQSDFVPWKRDVSL